MKPALSLSVQHVLQVWKEQGVNVRPGVTELDIQHFESVYHVRFSVELAQFFFVADGMNEGDCDHYGIRFWSLSELRLAVDELPEADVVLVKDYFVFADYSLWTHGYAVRISNGIASEVAIVGGATPVVVAQSFGEFLTAYVEDPGKLFVVER